MIVALWITAVLLTIVYLFSGVVKVVRSRAQLEPMMGWVTAATTWQVKVVGILEVLGAIGVILPLATGIAPVVTAIAAICLALVQIVAIPIHVRRKDTLASMSFNVVLLLLAVAVAVLRFATL